MSLAENECKFRPGVFSSCVTKEVCLTQLIAAAYCKNEKTNSEALRVHLGIASNKVSSLSKLTRRSTYVSANPLVVELLQIKSALRT